MTGIASIRDTDVELRWRAAPLALAMVTVAAAALAAAVIGSRWQLIAFVGPVLGVLCSVTWQPPAPAIRIHAQPSAQRCFESEHARLAVWVTTEPAGAAVDLAVSVRRPMRIDYDSTDSRDGSCEVGKVVVVTADRWGRYPIEATVTVVARGGLLAAMATAEVADVTVFPLAPPRSTPIPPSELLDRIGTHVTRHTGRGVEYADIRAYLPGDPLRAVNWPVSARRGSLHVTQRLTDRAADVVVLVDTYPQPRGPASQAVERAVLGAAQVAQSALRNGDRAGIVMLGGRRPRWLGVDIGQRQFYRVLDAVLGAGDAADTTTTTTTGTLAPRTAVPPGAVVVAFSTLLDTEFTLALIDLRKRGHAVLAVDVLPADPFDDAIDPLVTRLWALSRSAMYHDMRSIGVDIAPWPEDRPLEQSMRPAVELRRWTRRTRP